MSTLIPPTPASNKSTEQHQEPSEQDSFNRLLYKVLRMTSQQVQDLNGWMEHRWIPNVHEVIVQLFHKPHALEDNLKFITQGKTCHIQSNVMRSLSLMITYIRYRQYSTKSKYFGPFYYIQIDPQDYDEWRCTPPEEEIHFSGPNDEDEYQNLSSDDNQVIQQENFCSEPPEPLSYSLFQSHFQGSSTSNTQKIFLPKPTWEKPSKDQQQMIVDHKPNSGSPNLSTPNKSPSPFPHLPTPQQTAKSQQVHTHQSDESTTDTIKTETIPSGPLLAMAHQLINTSDDAASDISNVLSVKRSSQIQVCQCYPFQHANHTNQQLVDHGANGGLAGSDMPGIHRTYRKIKIQDIDNHEFTGLDVVTAATLLNTPQGKVIGIFNEYDYLWKGSSIHSSGQLEWLQTNVHETSVKVGGTQLINTLDGYSVPLLIKDGLVYATSLGRPTDQDMDTYPHVFITSPDTWDHSQAPDKPFGDPMFDVFGDFNQPIIANLNTLLDAPPGDCGSYRVHPKSLTGILNAHFLHGHPHPASRTLSMSPPGMELLHTPRITLKSTLSLAILFSASPDAVRLLQQTPSSLTLLLLMMVQPWPNSSVVMILLSVMHMASNQPYNSSTPSLITSENEEPWIPSPVMEANMKSPRESLISSIPYSSKNYQSESYHQDQNKAENCFGPAKRYTNTVMNTSGCLACCWLLCLQYICVVLHHLASPTLQGICPVQALQGTTPDISFMLHSSFYEPVYYRIDSSEPDFHFPSSSNGRNSHWVSFADNPGDRITWRIDTIPTKNGRELVGI